MALEKIDIINGQLAFLLNVLKPFCITNLLSHRRTYLNIGLNARNPVFSVCDQLWFQLAY